MLGPLFLDDIVISRMASSAYDVMMEEAESLQREEEEQSELPLPAPAASIAGGGVGGGVGPVGGVRMTRVKPLGPIKGV